MGEPTHGAVRSRHVPDSLVGKKTKEVLEWAREQLNGEEPNLSQNLIRLIKAGKLRDVVLRPRKAGFFLPTGEFVEAFDTAVKFGEDLSEHEEEWDAAEADWRWTDEENKRFNKTTAVAGRGAGRHLWEHGQRIAAYAEANERPPSSLLRLLDRRKGADGYGRRTHQTCLDFYRWKQVLDPTSPSLDWSWERVDAVLRFSHENAVRNAVADFLARPVLAGISDLQVTRVLARKQRSEPIGKSEEDELALEEVRGKMRRLEPLDPEVAIRVRRILDGK
jgi:hypothetical protein